MSFFFQPINQNYQNQTMLKLGWDHNIVILNKNSWQKANLVDKLTYDKQANINKNLY